MKPFSTTRVMATAATVIIMPVFISCQPRNGLVQETLPAESAVVDIMGAKTARVRSIYCDIMAEPLDAAGWELLGKASIYRKSRPALRRRTPPLTAFLVVLKNTVNAPIRLENARILGGDAVMEALTEERVRARFRSPAYSWRDFGRLLSIRRLLVEPETLKRIDLDRDTVETKLDFIPPQDYALMIIAFDRIPVEIRKFRVIFSVAAMGATREIAVEFNRHEYRAEKKKKKEELEEYD